MNHAPNAACENGLNVESLNRLFVFSYLLVVSLRDMALQSEQSDVSLRGNKTIAKIN